MPIFEYVCEECNTCFEQLVFEKEEVLLQCPECNSKNVKKLISAGSVRPHGIPKGSGGYKVPKCMSCGRSNT